MQKQLTKLVESRIQQLYELNDNSYEFNGKSLNAVYETLPEEYKERINCTVFKNTFKDGEFILNKEERTNPSTDENIRKTPPKTKAQLIREIKNKRMTETTQTLSNKKEKEPFELKVLDLSSIEVDAKNFIPFKTNKGIDILMSSSGGVLPGTSYVLIGIPGAGKTTNANMILSDIKTTNPDAEIMSLSSEMKQIDVEEELLKKPWMRNVPHILFSQYKKEHYIELLQSVFLYGYDVLVFDSFQNTIERLKSETAMNGNEAANFLMDLIEKACDGQTKTKKKTAVLIIQQVTKGGEFAGKNSLKHDTTGMLHFNLNIETGERSCVFSKNRRCGNYQHKEMYYYMDEDNTIQYDIKRFEEDREAERMLLKNKKDLDIQKEVFTNTFLNKHNSKYFEEEKEEVKQEQFEEIFNIEGEQEEEDLDEF